MLRILLVTTCALSLILSAQVSFAAESDGDLDIARKLERAFEKVAERVSPAVVVIVCTRSIDEEEAVQMFEHYFDKKPDAKPDQKPSPDRKKLPFRHPPVPDESEGSGILIRPEGYILTNNHVIDGAEKITVRLKDDRKFTAKVVGTDERTDLAVIKIDAKDLPAAKLADSDKVRVGQWAIAIGAPFQLEYSFTVGFVSGKGRSGLLTRGNTAYEDYIQTDAAINPGNSGGPLVNIEGEVIGINTLIRGLRTNIGFAIPANMVHAVSDQLIENKRVIRPWLGIEIQPVTEAEDLREYLEGPKKGVVVRAIVPTGPAAKSELRQADIITSVSGQPVGDIKELQQQVLKTKVGDPLNIEVFRNGKTVKLTVHTAEMPVQSASAATRPAKPITPTTFGLTVVPMTSSSAKKVDGKPLQGVLIKDVESNSPADLKGLRSGDVITEVDHKPVRTIEDFNAAIAKSDRKRGALVYYSREGSSSFTVLKEQ